MKDHFHVTKKARKFNLRKEKQQFEIISAFYFLIDSRTFNAIVQVSQSVCDLEENKFK